MPADPASIGAGGRRAALAMAALILSAPRARAQPGPAYAPSLWAQFKERFLAPEGRVRESSRPGRTLGRHQAMAMQFAVRANDRPAFERMLRWTLAEMALPGRGQFVWQWESGEDVPVNDVRNDTLGDLCFAWSFLLASQTWGQGSFAALALRVADSLENTSVVRVRGHHLLLPASYGYRDERRAVVSPAVHFLPALRALVLHTKNPLWQRLSEDALSMIPLFSFSGWSLPADWVEVTPGGQIGGLARDFPGRFGREAAYVPLSLLWAGESGNSCISHVRAAWRNGNPRMPPAWISLPDGAAASRPGGVGLEALAELVLQPGQPGRSTNVLLREAQDAWSALTVLATDHVSRALAPDSGLL